MSTRDVPPLISFSFIQFSGKILLNNRFPSLANPGSATARLCIALSVFLSLLMSTMFPSTGSVYKQKHLREKATSFHFYPQSFSNIFLIKTKTILEKNRK